MKYKYQGSTSITSRKTLERKTRKTPRRSTIVIRKVNNKTTNRVGKKRNMARRIAEVSMCGSCFTTLLEDVKSGFLEDSLNARRKPRNFSRKYQGGKASGARTSFKRKRSAPEPPPFRCCDAEDLETSSKEDWETSTREGSRGISKRNEQFKRNDSQGISKRNHSLGTTKRSEQSKGNNSRGTSKRINWVTSKKEGRGCKARLRKSPVEVWSQHRPTEVKVCTVHPKRVYAKHIHNKKNRRNTDYSCNSRELDKCLNKFQSGIERDMMLKKNIALLTHSRVEKQFQQFNDKLKSLDEAVRQFLEVERKKTRTHASYCRPVRQRGGTTIFVKDSLDFTPLTLNVRSEEFSFEYCVVISRTREIAVVSAYRSNNPLSDLDLFFERFEQLLGELSNFKYLVICADLNIDLLRRTRDSLRLRTLLNLFNLKPSVAGPTRICNTTETCIDNVFVNFPPKTLINEEKNIYSGLSDHQYSQVASFHTKLVITEKIFTRTYSTRQVDAFLRSLELIDFSPVSRFDDVNDQVNCFYNLILQPFNRHFPFKVITVGGPKKKKWVTRGLTISCAHKRQLFSLCKQTSDPILHAHYKRYCSVLNKVIKQAKKQYTLNSIKSAHKNKKSRVVWDVVRSFSKQNKPVHSQIKMQLNALVIKSCVLMRKSFSESFMIFFRHLQSPHLA
ncbi:hypothetical protein WDU94_000595 [Cyamophila willieti]